MCKVLRAGFVVLVDEVDEEEGFAGGERGLEADVLDVFKPSAGAEPLDDASIEVGFAGEAELDVPGHE